MWQVFLVIFFLFGCSSTAESVQDPNEENNDMTSVSDDRDRNRSRDLILNMEFSHNYTLDSSELWVGEPITVEFGDFKPQHINLHVRKDDPVTEFLDPEIGRAMVNIRFVRSDKSAALSHGFEDARGRFWEITKVKKAIDFPRDITLVVELRKPKLDQHQWIFKGNMKKVEKGDFLLQYFKLSVSKNSQFAKILSTKKARFNARIAFKRVFGQKTPQNGFIDRANRVWEIAQVELL